MYAQSKVDQRLALARDELGFTPEYHSVNEVIEFEKRLQDGGKYIYDPAGLPIGTQNLTSDDARWMQNEQALIQCDAAYFFTRYCFLRSEEGIVERFHFRVPQRIYFDIICDLQERNAAIEIMALKARQLGVSIFSELLIAHRIIFSYGAGGVLGSADQTKTREMSMMLLLCYDMLPRWMRPLHTSRVESDRGHLMFGQNASGVSFQHGSQKFGIATGSTPTLYHLSEVALYGDAAVKLIDEGLWKAVHASPNVLGILESTGRGAVGWWAKTWHYSKSHWPSARMFPMFLPWFCGVDIYPKETDRITHPMPVGWQPHRDTVTHAAKAALYVRSSPLLARHLIEEQVRRGVRAPDDRTPWTMPRDQQWYWEWNYREAEYKGTTSSFLQEMAGDDEEALQRSEESVFGHHTIEEVESRRERRYLAYGIAGQSIEDAHEPPPEDIDYAQERTRVRYRSRGQNAETYQWEFIPLLFGADGERALNERDADDAVGKLLVFHPPRAGVSYSIGVDTSEGKGEDATVISVWSVGAHGHADAQCAEFASPYVSHVEAFAFVLAVAAYYAQHMEQGVTRWREPYVSIEQVAAVGDTCQLQMGRMGYTNFHRMARYDSAPRKIMRQKHGQGAKRGWFTYGWSRPILTGNFVHAVQNGWAEVNSPWLIEEMKHFEVHYTAAGKERLEHEEGEHDDRIFASAMAVFCPHDMDVLAERSKKRIVESAALPRIDLAPSAGFVVSAAERAQNSIATLDDLIYPDAPGRF